MRKRRSCISLGGPIWNGRISSKRWSKASSILTTFLSSLLEDPSDDIEEQAFNCLVNISANSQDYINLLFKYFTANELMRQLERVLHTNSMAHVAVKRQVCTNNNESEMIVTSHCVVFVYTRLFLLPLTLWRELAIRAVSLEATSTSTKGWKRSSILRNATILSQTISVLRRGHA